ncbi:hypothetical protein KO493_03890 [Tamlana agarivorans]|uniref:Uncharacterized protein n=1 Tax=Pseudotamlana agarivorans TaxID=481183 RepID=A0ACC5U6B2_9FLAO|nr:hypothetical protein [Tamlana agarivorans]MBU2949835.1 hypothetical protein [Tamlana agarivorans]
MESPQISTSIPHYNPNRLYTFNAQNFKDSEKESNNNNNPVSGQDDIDDNGDDWTLIGDTTMEPGKGYTTTTTPGYFSANGSGKGSTFLATFKGKFNNGIYSLNIYRNDDEKSDKNWNLIGNPYPSALDSDAFFNGNPELERAIYFWSQNAAPNSSLNGNQQQNFSTSDYAIINNTGATSAGGDGSVPEMIIPGSGHAIPSGQSFFVSMENGASGSSGINSGTVTFNNAMRTESPVANREFFKQNNNSKTANTKPNKIWLNLKSTDNTANQILIGYVNGATDADDGLSYDADTHPLKGSYLYSIIPGVDKKFTIQGRDPNSLTINEVIPLGFKTTLAPSIIYTIALAKTEGDFFTTHNVILLDKDNTPATRWDLTSGDYIFTSQQTGEFNDRFEIVFEDSSLSVSQDAFNLNRLTIISLGKNQLQFNTAQNQTIRSIKIFDLLGQQLYQLEGDSHSETYYLPNLGAIYIAKVELSSGEVITKKGIC